jgi:hypothetical protein
MLKKAILAAAIAASVGSAMAQVVIVREAPPPVREERVPGPRAGWEWAPGHWDWRHGQYVWVQGHWLRERRGEHWVADRWERRGDRWERVAGHWERGDRHWDNGRHMGNRGLGDNDHDGVPNRFDSRPNNPYRQ